MSVSIVAVIFCQFENRGNSEGTLRCDNQWLALAIASSGLRSFCVLLFLEISVHIATLLWRSSFALRTINKPACIYFFSSKHLVELKQWLVTSLS